MKDQELDKLMRQITRDAVLGDTAADEIADSSTLWWSVQREIRNAESAKSPWPPNFLRRLLMIGVPAAAAVLVGLMLYANSSRTVAPETARRDGVNAQPSAMSADPAQSANVTAADVKQQPIISTAAVKQNDNFARKPIQAVRRTRAVSLPKTLLAKKSTTAAAEIKSDFIALAYARSPESGQLVRVKVPSSMMVSLGVVPTVNDPSKLIDAEVLVGDDGLTHAIRFIRQ